MPDTDTHTHTHTVPDPDPHFPSQPGINTDVPSQAATNAEQLQSTSTTPDAVEMTDVSPSPLLRPTFHPAPDPDPAPAPAPAPVSHSPSPSGSPRHHPHYLRRNEWLKHAAIGQLQFEHAATESAKATNNSIPRKTSSVHPPSYYNQLISRDDTQLTEDERVQRDHTLHHMSVYDVDINAPQPIKVQPEEMDLAVRWHNDNNVIQHPEHEVKVKEVIQQDHHMEEEKQVEQRKDGFVAGTTVARTTLAWDLIRSPPVPAEGHTPVPSETPDELDTNVYQGLTQQQVDQRQARDGKNELKEKRPNRLLKFLGYFINPIGLLIMAAAIISGVLKSWPDFGVITGLLFINAIIGFVEETRAESAVAALQQKLALKTHVLRLGEIRAGLEGVAVAEDELELDMTTSTSDESRLQLISVKELVRGDIFALRLGDIVPADARLLGLNKQHIITDDVLMIDQSALTGESLPVEKSRGDMVYSGSTVKQGQMLAVVVQTGERTFLGRAAHLINRSTESGHFQKVVARIGLFIIGCTLVLVIIILLVGVLKKGHSFLDELEQALVLTIASIPVGMPTVLSVTMAVGSNLLAKKHVIVKRLTAVEEMAAVDILCSDKTGTLTLNELSLDKPYVAEGTTAEELLFSAFLASESSTHDAIEVCVRTTAVKTLPQLTEDDLNRANVAGYKVFQFHPFDPISKLTRATIKNETDGTIFCVAKGAPHVILKLCADGQEQKEHAHEAIISMASHGLRALGVARSQPLHHQDVNSTSVVWKLQGLLSLLDPPRPDSKETIKQCQQYGIQVKMITGDATLIGREVAHRLGMFRNILPPSALHPTETRTEEEIVRCVEKADGFAQVVPEDKYRIVEMLQEAGHMIAMTGDGVNDAPALKKANVGIAVSGCTDAARSAADIVLLKPGLSAIVDGIITSRTIYQRMRSFVTYRITSTIHFLLFFFITIIAYGFSLPPILIIIIAIMNDAAVISVSVDNTHVSRSPDAWNLTKMFSTSLIFGICLASASLAHFYVARDVFDLTIDELQTVMFLQISSSAHFVIFATRTHSWFWECPPSWIFAGVMMAAQILKFFISVYGLVSAPIYWRWSLAIMSISLGIFVIIDCIKVMINRAWDNPKIRKVLAELIPTAASRARLASVHRHETLVRRLHLVRNIFTFLTAMQHKAIELRIDGEIEKETETEKRNEKYEQQQKTAADTYTIQG